MSIGEGRKFFIEVDGMLTEVLTVMQAAYRYKFAERTIRQWIDEEKIFATDIEGRWWIPKEELERHLAQRDIRKKL